MPESPTLLAALRDLSSDTRPVTEGAIRRLRAASPARWRARVRALALARLAAGAVIVAGLGVLPLPRAVNGVWAMGLAACPGRLVSSSSGLTGLGCAVDAVRDALVQTRAVHPDLSRIAHGPRAYSLVTRIDGLAGYDAAERWIGIAGSARGGELTITVTQRNAYHCCMYATVLTDGISAALGEPQTAVRAADLQALLLAVLVEGLPLTEGWQGRLDLPEIRTGKGERPSARARAASVSVRVTGRTALGEAPVWRVVVGRSTLYVGIESGRTLGVDEPTHLSGHQRELRVKR